MSEASFLSKVGEKYHDFTVTKVVPIDEIGCVLRELVHEPTGAQVMHLANDDPENLFCLSFRTLPKSSNGAPHILEHTILCGSKKFPVKDPFFAMTRRSLNTYMNALTGSDFTCYPAATQVEKDFYNLFDVYLDAVFHPQLKELSFLQEGHRLEFTDPEDPSTPLEYKGVVFNEMKGNMSSADPRLWQGMMAALAPDLPYAYNSGGDPKYIPTLTYDELIQFHETYYHPSQCLFFFYGNLPLIKHLDFIEEKTLKKVLKQPPLKHIPHQKRFSEPHFKEIPYPIEESEDLENKTVVSFGWLTLPMNQQEEILALAIIDSMMMNTDASLLKFPLLQSGLCLQVESYIDADMSEVPYVLILRGCSYDNVNALQKKLFEELNKLAEGEFPQELIEAALHQLELSRTEINGDSSPFGLTLFMRSALAKQHGSQAELNLKIHSLFHELRRKIQDPKYLPSLLKKYLIDNPHWVRQIATPDPELTVREEEEERARLDAIEESLTAAEKEKIVIQAKLLAEYQKETEKQSIDCLPKVHLSDVPPLTRDFPLHEEKEKNLRIFHHACFTNHFIYADLIFDLPDLDEEELFYTHLFLLMATEVGIGPRDYRANLAYLQSHIGSISATVSLYVQAHDSKAMRPGIAIRGKALERKGSYLFSLMRDLATSVRFDEQDRIRELLMQLYTSMQNRLNRNAMRYATQLATAGLNTASFIGNEWYGIANYQRVHKIVSNLEHELPKLMKRLQALKEKLFSMHEPHLVISCDKDAYAELKSKGFYGLGLLSPKPFTPWKGSFILPHVPSQARLIASPVAFTAEAFKSVTYIHPHSAALFAATQILDHKWLHPHIREKGGAYGTGASYNMASGTFTFYSYRDPHIQKTLETFHFSIDELAKGHFNERDLEEAKISIVQQLDSPISRGSRAYAAYAWWREGKTREMRQEFRDRLLSLTISDVELAAVKDLLPKKGEGIVVTFAGKELIEKEKLSLPLIPIL